MHEVRRAYWIRLKEWTTLENVTFEVQERNRTKANRNRNREILYEVLSAHSRYVQIFK